MGSVLHNVPSSYGAFKINAQCVQQTAKSVLTQLRAKVALRVKFYHLMVGAQILTSVLQYLATLSRTINAKFVKNLVSNALRQVNVYSVTLTHTYSTVTVLGYAPSI